MTYSYYPDSHELLIIEEEQPDRMHTYEFAPWQSEESALELTRALNRSETTVNDLIEEQLLGRNRVTIIQTAENISFPIGSQR